MYKNLTMNHCWFVTKEKPLDFESETLHFISSISHKGGGHEPQDGYH